MSIPRTRCKVFKIFISTKNRSSRPEVFCKNRFLKISQNSQKDTRATVSLLIKLQALGLQGEPLKLNDLPTKLAPQIHPTPSLP